MDYVLAVAFILLVCLLMAMGILALFGLMAVLMDARDRARFRRQEREGHDPLHWLDENTPAAH